MNTFMPSLFLSHGAPNVVLHPSPTRDFLSSLGKTLPRPEAILVASAHWETAAPALNTTAAPDTIYDFYGFEPEMYRMRYAAPGAQALAREAAGLLDAAGLKSQFDGVRGLDHGAWSPLMLMYPGADIPVAQVSVQPRADARHHHALGRALAPLRERGVLVVGSGNATHNLRHMMPDGSAPPAWVSEFANWMRGAVAAGRDDELLDWVARAPHALKNHPSPEHYLPFFVAMGAGSAGKRGELLYDGYTYGVLAMDAYLFH